MLSPRSPGCLVTEGPDRPRSRHRRLARNSPATRTPLDSPDAFDRQPGGQAYPSSQPPLMVANRQSKQCRPHAWTTLTANDGSAKRYSSACSTSPLVSHPPHSPGRLRLIRCDPFGGCPPLSSVQG